jgi:acyl-CoA thioesterase-1
MRFVFLLLLILLPLSHAKADDKKQALKASATQSLVTIAAFGDSLVAGYGLLPEDAMPAQLQQKLRVDGINAKVLNDGVSGDTTAGGRTRVPMVLQQKPSIAIIVFGGNDLLRALPVATIKDNLDGIMADLSKAGIKMLLMGQRAPASLGAAYTSPFNAMYADLAAKYHAALYPSYLGDVYGNPDLMQADGIHPNRTGVAVVVGKMEPQLLDLIQK